MTAGLPRQPTKAAPGSRAGVAGQTALAAVLWGSVGPLVALYPLEASGGFAVVRLVIGALVLAALALRCGGRAGFSREHAPIVIVGGLSVAAFQPLYFSAVHGAGVAVATFIAIGLSPVVTGVAGWLEDGIAPPSRWWGASVAAMTGLAILVCANGSAYPGTPAVGILLAALACVCYSCQAMTIDRLATSHGEPRAVGTIFAVGALMLLPSAMFTSWAWVGQPMLLLGGVYAGVVTLALAYRLFARGVSRLGPPTAVLISLLEPLAAAVLAILLVGEQLDAMQVTAALLLMAGVVASVTGNGRQAASIEL